MKHEGIPVETWVPSPRCVRANIPNAKNQKSPKFKPFLVPSISGQGPWICRDIGSSTAQPLPEASLQVLIKLGL